MHKFLDHWFSYSFILIWLVVCILCQKMDLVSRYANKGTAIIGKEYYRFATALILHNQFLHAIFNAATLYFVGQHLEPQIQPGKLLIFSVLIGVITETVFSAIFRESVSMGGSPIVFSQIGLIAALQILRADAFKFQLGTWYGSWILGYTVLANIPFFSDNFISSLIIHGMPLTLGIVLGCLGVGLRIL